MHNGFYLFKLTDFARQELLSEVSLNCTKDNQLTYTEDIVAKPMYYNPVEEKQIKQLSSLLKQENFINVQQRLKKMACVWDLLAYFMVHLVLENLINL